MKQSEKTVCGVPTTQHSGEDYLVVKDLVKIFGNNTVADHVSFCIEKAEMVTLLGLSGCGKSTTLRCIAGLESLDGGEILIGDRREIAFQARYHKSSRWVAMWNTR